ncbi:MAG: hypothetical protein WA941_20270 [Nitrososphaeraceae archaeon]
MNKKHVYVRGVDSVSFRSRFKGNLTGGYFMNKISAQIPTGVHDISAYLFHPQTPNIESSRRYVVLYHPETAEIWNEIIGKKIIGKLNGDVDTGWLYLDWKIPEKVRVGTYVIKMMVMNKFTDYSESYMPVEDTFSIIDSTS